MSVIYPLYKRSLLAGDTNVDLDNDNATDGPYCALVDTGSYTYDAAHQFYSSLSGIVGTDQRITVPTVSADGIFDGADLLYSLVGGTIGALVIYRKNAGANTTWRLVAFIDAGSGLPTIAPVGSNVTVIWGAQGIFRL